MSGRSAERHVEDEGDGTDDAADEVRNPQQPAVW